MLGAAWKRRSLAAGWVDLQLLFLWGDFDRRVGLVLALFPKWKPHRLARPRLRFDYALVSGAVLLDVVLALRDPHEGVFRV